MLTAFFFKKFGYSRLKQYLYTNKSHHASRRKTSGPGWDVSFNQIHINQNCPVEMSNTALSEYFATDYYVNDSNSVGASYHYYGNLQSHSKGSSHQTILRNGQPEGIVDMTEVFENDYQQHTVNIYYVGKMGRLGIDFNGSYFNYRSGRDDEAVEISRELGNRNVHSDSRQRSQVYAAKNRMRTIK